MSNNEVMRAEHKHGDQLSREDLQRLQKAMDELRSAVAGYESCPATEQLETRDVVPLPLEELAREQRRITEAEAGLWRLREELLGWARPTSLPGAGSVTDWFSEEDEIYDKMGEVSPTAP